MMREMANEPALPDGSSFFVAEVISKEEAMALPVEKRPICFRISSGMYHAVFEAIGAASMCWNPRPGDAVFSSEEASKVAVDLCFKIADEVEARPVGWPDIGQDPLKAGDYDLENALVRLRKGTGLQQKEVPDQTQLAWRVDVSRLINELSRLRGSVEVLKRLQNQSKA